MFVFLLDSMICALFGHDLIVPHRGPDLGSDDATGVRPYGSIFNNIRALYQRYPIFVPLQGGGGKEEELVPT